MRRRLSLLTTVTTTALLATAAPGGAAQFAVDTTADGLGDCALAGQCTLRQALQSANATPERDTVALPAGTFELTGQDLIVTINDAVDIIGAGAGATILREVSGGDGRVLLLEQNASVHLFDLSVTGSREASAVLLFGGGVELRATGVVFRDNTAARGGAIDGTGGSVVLENSAVVSNSAAERGGGIHLDGAASSLALLNTTVSGNSAPGGSGISLAAGSAALSFTTVWGNTGAPGELDVAPGAAAQLRATIAGRCSGLLPASLGSNIEPGTSCGLGGPGDRPATEPGLGPLGDNGGPTPTHLPVPGGAAIDGASGCPPPAADQRGVARPQGGACDVGAVEAVPTAPPPAADTTAPVISGLSLLRSRFRVGGPRTPTIASRAGTTIRYTLSELADVRVTMLAARAGRRSGGRCAPPARRLRRAPRCTRWTARLALRRTAIAAGPARIAFSGRTARTRLSPGRHRLRIVATDPAGNRSRVRTAAFTVARR